MSTIAIVILVSIVATAVLSVVIGNFLYKRQVKKRKEETEEKAKLILKEAEIAAENLKKDRILEAKEKILKMRSEFEEEANKKKNLIITNEQKIKQREQTLSKEIENLKRKEGELDDLKTDLAAQLESEGARAYTEEQAELLTQEALQSLEQAQPQGEPGHALRRLALRLLHRNA